MTRFTVLDERTLTMVRTTHWFGILLLVCTASGCNHFFDYADATCYSIKCRHQAKLAWMNARDLYGCVSHPYNFGEGFRAGYADVCMGNETGCTPPVPPRRYWSSCYMNSEGRAKAIAWSDGFAHGALAASCDGCAGQCQIATFGVGHGCSGSGGGNQGYGTALKGYRPPPDNQPQFADPHGSHPDGLGPSMFNPTPGSIPSPTGDAIGPDDLDSPIDGEGGFAPQPSTDSGLPLEVWRQPTAPPPPRAAEAYHAPVF